jgi:hypothetical protein
MRVALVGLLLAVSAAVAAPVPKEFREKRTDKERIVGSWVPFPGGPGNTGAWEFFADGTAKLPGRGANEPPILYTMDPTATPKAFTWKPSWGSWTGVYELTGDEFRIAIVSGNGAVPREAKPGTGYEYYEFRRAK